MAPPNDPRANDLVIVTGASRGIGRATVRSLVLERGARVLALARDGAALATLATECASGLLEVSAMDLAEGTAVQQVLTKVAGRKLRALVHNAGLLHNKPMGLHTEADLARTLHTNVVVPLLLSQALAEHLAGDPPGHIVHISSMGGFQDSVKFPGLVGYSASKAALTCMAQCLAVEFSGRGIHSNCLALGSVDTDMLRAAFPNYKATTTAADMGAFIAEFALNGHRFFNGKVLPVATSTP
jgi:3-oxoacyl-[acyl-carrier protein] reductase